MSFRTKIFLSFTAVVLLTALIEGALDLIAVRGHEWLETRTERQIEEIADSLAASIELRGETPVRSGLESANSPAFRQVRYRILRDGQIVQGERRQFPVNGVGWATADRALMAGFHLEVAFERSPLERFVANDLLVDLADLPLFLALAFLISWLLARAIIRPVHQLTVASEQLARQQFPEPLTVPAGDDEISRMATSFNTMSESIHGYLERERTLTRYASHELRTPLAALSAQIERAKYGLTPQEEILPALERNVTRMQEILGALLSLARHSDRAQDPMPLSPLLRELLRALPREDRARVLLSHTDQPIVITDARLVQQAIGNLLDNALKYTESEVELVTRAQDHTLLIEVRDEGPGIPTEVLRAGSRPVPDGNGHSKGTGLGLSLVTRIAQALKGHFDLRNTGTGLVAALTLPVVVSNADERASESSGRSLVQ